MSRRVRPPSESAKSRPSCRGRDLSQSSFPCSRVREQRLPDCFFQVCAFSLFLLGKEIVSHNFRRKERFAVVIVEISPVHQQRSKLQPLSPSPVTALCARCPSDSRLVRHPGALHGGTELLLLPGWWRSMRVGVYTDWACRFSWLWRCR